MHRGLGTSRICATLVLAAATAACATRSSPATYPRPAPFPNATSYPSIRPELTSGPTVTAPDALIQTALSLEGVPYQWGGDQPSTGFDCSGFVQYVLRQHHIAAPRTTAEQFLIGKQV
ncbi:MAG TPA: NlpC/P60 family protein, partial [Vicinamibacterales bacterium]|nr:NlpC/P60 family protein [Vicinamibacterales bacterium]